jgi:hypothetical protein
MAGETKRAATPTTDKITLRFAFIVQSPSEKNWEHSPGHDVPRCTITTVIEPLSRSAIPKSSLLQCRPAMLKKHPAIRKDD